MNTLKVSARLRLLSILGVVAAILPFSVQAQDEDLADISVTPPRLSVAEGQVRVWRAGGDDWESAAVNVAMGEGDTLSTGDNGTMEIQIGARDFARFMANSQLTLVTHDSGLMQFRLDDGQGSLDLRGSRDGQLVRIDTENVNLVVGGRGYYRISMRDGETRIIVRAQGRATLTFGDGRSRTLSSGQQMVVRGADSVRAEVGPAPAEDTWDRWNDARSDYYARSASYRYVPDNVYGAADLDRNGRWYQDGTYGWTWIPTVASGWAPYSRGHWQWDAFYGWTWVDDAPWGWATSHYGRWVFVNGYWAWAPGPRGGRVVYAPALVNFFQGDAGLSWVALGWGEPLLPWWGRPTFRERPWWGGWGGPREHYHDNYHYRNRDVGHAVIGGRDHDFDRYRSRGAMPPPVRNGRPVYGTPFDGSRGTDRRDSRPEYRSDRDRRDARPDRRQDEPIIATPKRGPGTDPQYRREQPQERNYERPADRSYDRPADRTYDRPVTRPVERPVDRPNERQQERQQERTMERRYPPPTPPLMPVEPMRAPRVVEPTRNVEPPRQERRNNDFNQERRDPPQRDMHFNEPRVAPRGVERDSSPREDRGGGNRDHIRRPGDRF